MKEIPIALQLWSLHADCQKDFAKTVTAVSRIGYGGVELAGYGSLNAAGAARALNHAGLRVCGMHVGLPRLRAELAQVIEDARLFGANHVTCPSWPKDEFVSGTACQKIGEQLNAIGAVLQKAGLKFSYHNHAPEFVTVDGRRVLDWILDAAEPRNLGCQLDVYWAHAGGKNPAKYIWEQGRRIELIHLKDETELGLGPVNFTEVFTAVDAVGAAEWYIVEQEKYNHSPLDSVRLSFDQLKKWGKV